MSETYTFDVHSPKHGVFTVTAPLRFKAQLSAHTHGVNRHNIPGRPTFYVTIRLPGRRRTFLHRYIWELLGKAPVKQIDHVDRDTMNNADTNLRDGTFGNAYNVGKKRSNTSGYIGVSFHGVTRKWLARARTIGKEHHLGLFCDPIDAAKARDAFVARHHGEFAVLNFPSSESER